MMGSNKEGPLWNLKELIAGIDKAPPGTFRFLSDFLENDSSRENVSGIFTRVSHFYLNEDGLGRSFFIANERECKETGGCCVDFAAHWTLESGVTYCYQVHITEGNQISRISPGASAPHSSTFDGFTMPKLDIDSMIKVVKDHGVIMIDLNNMMAK